MNNFFVVSFYRSSHRKICIGIALALLIVGVVVLIVVLSRDDDSCLTCNDIVPSDKFKAGNYSKAGVASDHTVCSTIGANILKEGGNAADAAIATTFCAGVANPFSCGIGGGGFLVYFNKTENKFYVYDYREEAPAAATEMMFENKSSTFGT